MRDPLPGAAARHLGLAGSKLVAHFQDKLAAAVQVAGLPALPEKATAAALARRPRAAAAAVVLARRQGRTAAPV